MKKRVLYSFLTIFFTSIAAAQQTIYLEFSIPKAGTHLLAKTIRLIAKKKMYFPGRIVSEAELINRINNLSTNQFLVAHQTYSNHLENYLDNQHCCKIFIMYRDPRDQIISFAHFIHKYPELWPALQSLSMDELILYLIRDHNYADHGLSIYTTEPELFSINALYRSFLPWKNCSLDCCAVRFEDLIGEKGGGNYQTQVATISRIATFMGYHLTKQEVDGAIENLFGGTFSFREGKIGEWRQYFNEQHKQVCKDIIGPLLIELGYENDFSW